MTDRIVIRAFEPRKQLPVKISPCQDSTGNTYTGQGDDGYFEHLTEEDKQKMAYVITPQTVIVLSDGKVLDMKKATDRANWKWMSGNADGPGERKGNHPYLVLDKSLGASSNQAVFYIENRAKDAEKRVSSSKARDKARYMIQYELSQEGMQKVGRVLGHPSPETFSLTELQDYLLNLAETIPEAIISAADPDKVEQSEAITFVNDLIRLKVIQKYKGGVWKAFGSEGEFVGHNEKKIQEFVMNPEKRENVVALEAALAAAKELVK